MNPTLKFIAAQIKRYKRETFIGTILLICTNALLYWITVKISGTVDSLVAVNLKANKKIWLSLGFIGLLALLMAFIRTGSRIVLFGVGRQIESDLKQNFYDHLLKLDLLYFNTQRIGDLISRATSDIQAVRQMMGFGLLNVINIVWVYAFTLPLMFSLNPTLTAWILLGYLPILALVRYLSIKLKHGQQLVQEQLGGLSSFIEEDINGIQVVKAYSQEERETGRFKKLNAEYLQTSTELAQWRGLIWPIMEAASRISFFALVYFVNKGALSAGTIAAFLICLDRLVFPTAIVGWLITIFQRGSVSVGRVNEILEEKPQIISKTNNRLEITHGDIEVKNLTFAFNEKAILSEFSLKIAGGSFIGIVGLIGSGKSTFCNCLLRLTQTPEASIFIDNTDITNTSLHSLREQIGYVPQESFLFNESIAYNIAFGGNFSKEQIEEVAKLASINKEIQNFPQKYETIVGEKGVAVSGGQAQRIALARALIKKPKILVLDDAIASVDNEIGLQILRSLRENQKGQTLILVTHRISSLKDADEIFVIDSGKCVGSGKHSHLLRHNPVYQKLWKKQKLVGGEV